MPKRWLKKWLKCFGLSTGRRDEQEDVLKILDEYSMSGINVLRIQYQLGKDITNRKVEGDFVECGVCNGGSAGAIVMGIEDKSKKVWLYDSFEGVPEPSVKDGEYASQFGGYWKGTEEKVKEVLSTVGIDDERSVVKKGWFEDTFKYEKPDKVCFLHIDADWYESVLLSLESFYDSVEDGGIILLDDFGHWEGCREAFYKFCRDREISPLVERFGHTQMFWVKNRKHNRDYRGKGKVY